MSKILTEWGLGEELKAKTRPCRQAAFDDRECLFRLHHSFICLPAHPSPIASHLPPSRDLSPPPLLTGIDTQFIPLVLTNENIGSILWRDEVIAETGGDFLLMHASTGYHPLAIHSLTTNPPCTACRPPRHVAAHRPGGWGRSQVWR